MSARRASEQRLKSPHDIAEAATVSELAAEAIESVREAALVPAEVAAAAREAAAEGTGVRHASAHGAAQGQDFVVEVSVHEVHSVPQD